MKKLTTLRKTLGYSLLGMTAGFVNGFLGTGGGIILLFSEMISGENRDSRDRYAETLCVTLVLSAVSACFYFIKGSVGTASLPVFCIPAVFGGICGAFLLDRLPAGITGKIFAVLVIIAGGIMLLK